MLFINYVYYSMLYFWALTDTYVKYMYMTVLLHVVQQTHHLGGHHLKELIEVYCTYSAWTKTVIAQCSQ